MKLTTLLLLAALSLSTSAVRPLSPKAQAIYDHVVSATRRTPSESGVSANNLLASGRLVTDLADYGDSPSFCQDIYLPAIVQAKEEVLITTFLFERGSYCGKAAVKAITALNQRAAEAGRKVRVNFIISTLSQLGFLYKNDDDVPKIKLPRLRDMVRSLSETDPQVFDLPRQSELSNVEFRVKTYHNWVLGAIHNKLLIVDGKTLLIGSKNWDALHGFEYAARLEGTIAATARQDFMRMWQEPLPALSGNVEEEVEGAVPIMYLSRSSNNHFTHPEDSAQDQGWLKALDVAQKHVYIQSPNFIAKTVMDAVLKTVRRGVKVTVVTSFSWNNVISFLNAKSAGNNRVVIQRMYADLADEPQALANLNMCYFIGKRVVPPQPQKKEFAHVKFMAIDDEMVIFGSGNQDTQSWYNSSEANVLIDDPATAQRILNRLLEPQASLKHCYRDLLGLKPVNSE